MPEVSPLFRAQLCITECQYFYPDYWRTTITRDAYQRCLDGCSGLPSTTGDEQEDWTDTLVREVGQDLQTVGAGAVDAIGSAARSLQDAIKTDLLLLAVIATAVYLTTRRLT